MTSHLPARTNDGVLPQHGFGANTSFKSLLTENPFLFRIYTPKERSPFFDDTDPYFLAPKFNERFARSPVEIRNHQQFGDEWNVNYADVAKHMDWTGRVSSPFISTSFSFAWCIWDALRRFHIGVKKDVQVAIIDGQAIADRAATAVELLELSSPHERNKAHRSWHRFSVESQLVLVHGSIPGTAVLASIPLLAILRHLPSYFLRPGFNQINAENPLLGIGWDYMEKRPSYRRFCREMSTRFLSLNTEEKLADSTAGALSLALAFLRPWFHRTVDIDCYQAVQTLTELASIIAQWPGQSWVCGRPEIYELTYAMASTLCQELRERNTIQAEGEVSRLQGVVDELHQVVREYEGRFNSLDKRPKSNRVKKPTLFINPVTPVFSPPTPSPPCITPAAASVQTPLTPPDTPKSTTFVSSLAPRWVPNSEIPTTPLSAAAATSINALANQTVLPSKHYNLSNASTSPSDNLTTYSKLNSIALTPTPTQPQRSQIPPSASLDIGPEEIPLPPSPFQPSPIASKHQHGILLSPSSLTDNDSWTVITDAIGSDSSDDDDDTQVDEDSSYRKDLQDSVVTLKEAEISPPGSPTLVIAPLPASTSSKEDGPEYLPPRARSGIFAEPLEFDYSQVDIMDDTFHPRNRMLETASRFVTGFLIGAFITAAIFSPQRRMIVHLT